MSSRLSVSHSTSTAPRNLATKECINRYYSTNSFKRGRRSFSPREHVNWEGGGSTNLLTRRNDHIPLPGATDRNIPWHARFSLKSTRRQTVFLLHRSCLCLVPHQNLKKTNHRNTFLKRRAKEWVKVVCETRKRAHSQQTPLCTRVAQLQTRTFCATITQAPTIPANFKQPFSTPAPTRQKALQDRNNSEV